MLCSYSILSRNELCDWPVKSSFAAQHLTSLFSNSFKRISDSIWETVIRSHTSLDSLRQKTIEALSFFSSPLEDAILLPHSSLSSFSLQTHNQSAICTLPAALKMVIQNTFQILVPFWQVGSRLLCGICCIYAFIKSLRTDKNLFLQSSARSLKWSKISQ